MKGYLLDTNLLIALLWPAHARHRPAVKWFARHRAKGWASCPLTEASFVRIVCLFARCGHASGSRRHPGRQHGRQGPRVLAGRTPLGGGRRVCRGAPPVDEYSENTIIEDRSEVIERGQDFAVYERTVVESDSDGRITTTKSHFTLLENALHYFADGEWSESEDLIESFPGGAVALRGPNDPNIRFAKIKLE